MQTKRLLRKDRPRLIPPSFSWVDHRLIRHDRLRDCDPPAWALYLFLVAVADADGLSFYSEASLARRLRVDLQTLACAREQLLRAELIAYERPLYQVLGLDPAGSASPNAVREDDAARSAGDILRAVLGAHGGAAR
jgi:hypothetical protein